MAASSSFGSWVRRRRKALALTQPELARRVGCAVITIQKIEADQRHPSRQIAERLADQLAIPTDERTVFLQAARADPDRERRAAAPRQADRAPIARVGADRPDISSSAALSMTLPGGTV